VNPTLKTEPRGDHSDNGHGESHEKVDIVVAQQIISHYHLAAHFLLVRSVPNALRRDFSSAVTFNYLASSNVDHARLADGAQNGIQ